MSIADDMGGEGWRVEGVIAVADNGRMMKDVIGELRVRQAALKARLDKGVIPDDFKKGQALLASYEAAMTGLDKAWRRAHS